ncbi:hypothetical protein [Arcanobacterium hippocoleae]|uniref:hypothetical protein n=1 Tax=Arcanobacterium hippocoleae TaxID=149017 RepID=UPI003341C001
MSQKPVFELSALQLIVDKAQKSLKALLENQVKLQQKITHFAQLKELETTTQTTADRITQLTEQLAKIRAERAEIGSEITQIPLQKAAAMQALADATEKSSKLLQLEKELAHLLEISKAFTIRKEAEAALAIANSRLLKAAQKLHKIKSEYQETLRQWQKSFAADLAQELSTGSACPVCGATEHPAPAESTQQVSAAQVEQAQEKLDRAHHAFNDATVQQQACEITVAKLSEQTTNFAEHKIKTDISTTREMITAAQNAESEKAAANEKITLLSNQLADLTTKDTQLALTEKAAATELTLLTTQVTANEKHLPPLKTATQQSKMPSHSSKKFSRYLIL